MAIIREILSLIIRLVKDGILLVAASGLYIIFLVWIMYFNFQTKAGFYCNDLSIGYSYRKQTVSTGMLTKGVGLLLPFIVFLIIELCRIRKGQHIEFCNLKIPKCITEIYIRMVHCSFGGVLQYSLVLLPKFFDVPQFLRPHFLAVCQPLLPDNTTCYSLDNQNRFISEYECQGVGFNQFQVMNSYGSFPSGHASLSFYIAVYLCLYIQQFIGHPKLKESKFFLHLLFFVGASSIAITRIQDHYHRGIDVIFGAVLGSISGYLNYRYGYGMFEVKSEVETKPEGTNRNGEQVYSFDTIGYS